MGFTIKNKINNDTLKISSSGFNDIRKAFLCILFEKEYQDISNNLIYYFNESQNIDNNIKFLFVKKDTHGSFQKKQVEKIVSFFNSNKNEIYIRTGLSGENDFIIKPFIDYIEANKENSISY